MPHKTKSPENVLQFCPFFREARRQQWPHGATLQEQLWGNLEDLLEAKVVDVCFKRVGENRSQSRAQELCESRGGRPELPVPNKLYGFCGRLATLKAATQTKIGPFLRVSTSGTSQ